MLYNVAVVLFKKRLQACGIGTCVRTLRDGNKHKRGPTTLHFFDRGVALVLLALRTDVWLCCHSATTVLPSPVGAGDCGAAEAGTEPPQCACLANYMQRFTKKWTPQSSHHRFDDGILSASLFECDGVCVAMYVYTCTGARVDLKVEVKARKLQQVAHRRRHCVPRHEVSGGQAEHARPPRSVCEGG
jgi:hypothetical protein